jgi:hypothetical protein
MPIGLKNTIIRLPLYRNEKLNLHVFMRMFPQAAFRKEYILFFAFRYFLYLFLLFIYVEWSFPDYF